VQHVERHGLAKPFPLGDELRREVVSQKRIAADEVQIFCRQAARNWKRTTNVELATL
jgi:hypothetical protein